MSLALTPVPAVRAATPQALADAGAADAAPAAASPSLPALAELVYRTTANMKLMGLPVTLHARTKTRWQLDGGRYETHLHMDTIDFDEVSRGQLAANGTLVPERYQEKRPFHDPEAVDIDWAQGRVRFGTAAPTHTPDAGAQDRLSLQFELARRYQREPQRFANGSVHAVNLIGTHDVDVWNFAVATDQSVDTGRGAMRAVRFSAHRTVGSVEETMEVWLGADLQWLPVRIRIVDRKQSVIDSVLEEAVLP